MYLATGTPKQRNVARSHEPLVSPYYSLFGPPDVQSQHTDKLMRWKVKMASNDDMRNQFLDQYIPKIREVGITLPDPNLREKPRNGLGISDPDWGRVLPRNKRQWSLQCRAFGCAFMGRRSWALGKRCIA